jgi:hypothetical protein
MVAVLLLLFSALSPMIALDDLRSRPFCRLSLAQLRLWCRLTRPLSRRGRTVFGKLPGRCSPSATRRKPDLSLTATDAAGDTLTYSATGLPSGVFINSSTGAITGTVGLGAYGASPYQVTVTVAGGGSSASHSFIWTVTPRVGLANPGTQGDAGGDNVSLQVNATGFAGGSLSYSVTGLPSGLSINASSGLISGSIPTSAISSSPYNVTVKANDGTATATQAFPWDVVALNLPTVADQDNLAPVHRRPDQRWRHQRVPRGKKRGQRRMA